MVRTEFPPAALVVDDDDLFRSSLVELLRQDGYETIEAATLAAARTALARGQPDLVLLDLQLPDGRGLDLKLDGRLDPATPFVVVSGDASTKAKRTAEREGAADYLVKPVETAQLRAVLHALGAGRELRKEVSALRGALADVGRFGRMLGRSDAMRDVYDLIGRVAPTSAPVLLTGESGTGKEVAAATIHEMSPRRGQPFVAINCGAISASLIESSLFGHEKGAFTGAGARHQGVFEQADGGTFFLDEIGEMPRDLQVRLLRVLEERLVRRVGGDRDIPIDVRVIAATNRDPQEAVAEGLLREDLFHRLNVFPIHMPPLRDRAGDARILAEYFLDERNAEAGTHKRFGPDALTAIDAGTWPGNVRALRNAVDRAWILADDLIDDRSFPQPSKTSATAAPASASGAPRQISIRVGVSLDQAERALILATLAYCEGNKRRTARTLGVSVKTLYSRLARYEAEPAGVTDE